MASLQEVISSRQNVRLERKIKITDAKFPGKLFLLPVTMFVVWKNISGRIYFQSQYNQSFIDNIKALDAAKWHGHKDGGYVPAIIGTNKVWSLPINEHNIFQLSYLDNDSPNPYQRYDGALDISQFTSSRPLKAHQLESKAHLLLRRWAIWAEEMGIGKSLAAIDAVEYFISQYGYKEPCWWIAPRSALASVELELRKWGSRIQFELYTYDALKKKVSQWRDGDPAPRVIIFDEAHLIKNPTSQRSEAANHVARSIRKEHNTNCLILAMTGTPAPKSPSDWWNLANTVCPGFLKEGSKIKLEKRMSLIQERENLTTGGIYPHRVTWFDNEAKCAKCGEFKDDVIHEIDHPFMASKNEVNLLYERLKGLVLIKFKKDCLDLPEKHYRMIQLKPKQSILNAAKIIKAKSPTTIQALTLLRELSDGFQYKETKTGEKECTLCLGVGEYQHPGTDDKDQCPLCRGKKIEDIVTRETIEVPTPKIDLLKDLLEEHSDVGRFVTYAGFTGSIDRIVKTCASLDWTVIKVDGRGPISTLPGKFTDWIERFQNGQESNKIVFVGHPRSGGMGLTLTASPSIFYYSNDFDAAARTQSEDRIHRDGMDVKRGATIIDCEHLPTDRLVFDNLKKKRDLEKLSLGELELALNSTISQL